MTTLPLEFGGHVHRWHADNPTNPRRSLEYRCQGCGLLRLYVRGEWCPGG